MPVSGATRFNCTRVWLALSVLATVGADRVAAQTRLEWRPDTVALTRYTTVEGCLALIARVRDSVASTEATWRDTVPMTVAEASAPLPAAVHQSVGACAARFTEPSASLDDFAPLLTLYLLAGRDADAASLVKRRLAAIAPTKDKREHIALLDSIIHTYAATSGYFAFQRRPAWTVQPARPAAAEPFLNELDTISPTAPLKMRVDNHFLLAQSAWRLGDTALAVRQALKLLDITSKMKPAEWRSGVVNILGLYQMLSLLYEPQLLDSLRRGTAGYVALHQANWVKATGMRPEALLFPIGKSAKPIEGDYWSGRADSSASRPGKGKVSLVVFFGHRCLMDRGGCWPVYLGIQRLAKRFPALELTLVTNTLGYLSELEPPKPADEAAIMGRWLLGDRKLPVTLAITNSPFWRLPDPDRRRIDSDLPNVLNYQWAGWGRVGAGASFLVDPEGTIVAVGNVGNRFDGDEGRFGKLIEVLLARQTASR